MDDDRDLANWLFANATTMLEDAACMAATGQSSQVDASQLIDLGQKLQAATHDITIIVQAAAIIATRSANEDNNS